MCNIPHASGTVIVFISGSGESEWRLLDTQEFLLYKDFIAIYGISDLGTYLIRVLKADEVKLTSGIMEGIVLPYQVPSSNELFVHDEIYNKFVPFSNDSKGY